MLGQISKHYPQATIYFISHVKIGTDFFPAINQSGYRQADYEKATSAWEEYLSTSDEVYKLSRDNKQAEAAKIMIGSAYEKLYVICKNN